MKTRETPRLNLRQFNKSDSAFILALLNTPAWIRNIGDRNVKNEMDALNYLEKSPMTSYHRYGFGLNCVVLKGDNLPIGMCGLIKRDTLEDADIGFAFLPEYEGKGYAMEAAISVLAEAKEFALKRVVAITLPDNERSITLLKRINMNFEKMIQFPGDEKELMLFAIAL